MYLYTCTCTVNSFFTRNVHFRLDESVDILSEEVCLDFTRSMNKILFDKTVTANPVTFPFVTLPEPDERPVPNTGLYLHCTLHMTDGAHTCTCICTCTYVHIHVHRVCVINIYECVPLSVCLVVIR